LVKETDVLPVTPNLSAVVQEIVNRDGWAPGPDKAITFIIDKVSGSGFRYARSFDGYNPSAALFHVEYNDGSGVKTIETRIKKATDDGECSGGIPFSTSTNKLTIGNCGVGLRFEGLTIPKNSTITNAWMKFVPYQTLSDPITVKVSAHKSDNSPSFNESVSPQLMETMRPRTTANVTWNVEPWTGVTVETKIDVAKTVIGELVKDTGISWGFGSWANDSADGYVSTIDYTKIHAGCNAHTAAHQAKLQAAVAGLVTHSSTPYAPSMDAARKYFSKLKAEWDPILNAEAGIKFQDASCQPKFLIEVSDGMGNVPSMSDTGLYGTEFNTYYKNLVASKANALADAGISTIGVGFGIPEGEEEQIYTLAEVANTRGKASTSDSLYAMHQEDAATGKGLPYLATNKDELMNVFRTIMNSVKGAVFFGSAPAATTSTDLGDMVVLASFNAGNWTGEIEAIAKDTTTGKWNASLWKASENMPATRNVWTVDSGNNLTAYTTSTLAGDNYLCKKIGDIVHSTPMVVAAPPFFYAFDNYSSFKRNLSVTSPREKMAYVGSNDGLLHAFSLETGQERWAFLPKSLQAKLNEAGNGASYDPCSSSYCHRYLLDGSPQVADVYGVFGGASKWRTMLVVGQRGGGTAYTALDVTKGESFGAGADQAKYLWELTDAELGESWSEAAIERVSYPGGGTGATAWGVFVSSGYSENDNTQYLKEGYLYGLEAATGTGLWSDGTTTITKIKVTPEAGTLNFKNLSGAAPGTGVMVRGLTSGAYGAAVVSITNGATGSIVLSNVFNSSFVNNEQIVWSGSSAAVDGAFSASTASQKNNALSSPVTGNFYAPDHTEDCIYVGDLYGTMYRVDSIGKGQTPSASKLFKFNPYPSGPDERPIRGKASIAYNEGSSGLWVYYGTGRYETAADKVNNQQQYFFGLKDAATPRATPYSVADLTTLEARFTAATIGGKAMTLRTINGSNTSANPWAMKLFAGQSGWGGSATSGGSERVFTKPLVVGGIVFFTTFIPDADICTGSGDTYVFALDYKTGMPPTSPVFDLNGDGKFTDADKVLINGSLVMPIGVYVGRGQGSAPVLFKDTLFITTSTPQAGSTGSGNVTGLNSLLVNIPQKKIRVESWKHN
jgi:Tfp pilus tip-associated adhesin PilY1